MCTNRLPSLVAVWLAALATATDVPAQDPNSSPAPTGSYQPFEGSNSPPASAPPVAARPSTADSRRPSTGVAARVNGSPILQSEIQRGLAAFARTQPVEPSAMPLLTATMLQQLIDRKLVQDFLKSQKLSATREEVEAVVNNLRSKLRERSMTLDTFLKNSGQTETSFRANLAHEIAWNKYVTQNTSDAALETFFGRYREQFDGTQRRVSHIVLRPESGADEQLLRMLVEKSQKIRDQIAAGEITFEEAAEKHSVGPSRRQGGDLGFIPLQGVMSDQFSRAAFSIERGEITKPVLTNVGVHLIKVTDIKPGEKTWRDVREPLQAAFGQNLFNQLVSEQRKTGNVEFLGNVPHFKPGTTELETSPAAADNK